MRKSASVLAASALAILGTTAVAHAVPAVGLASGNALFSFDTPAPGTTGTLRSVTGLQSGESLYAIDYRPATGALYGLGGSGALYTLDAGTGAATFASTLSTPLSGNSFDIAFNPTVDRLRVVGTSGQDLRVNVDSGAVTVDGAISYAAGDPNSGKTPGVSGVAYTNQLAGTVASTTLYDLDAANGVLAIQNPPNNGTLGTVGSLGVGNLLSFDIDGNTGTAYAATAGALYQLNLATGATTLTGGFGAANVTDFALVQVPEPATLALLGCGLAGLVAMRRRRAASLG